MKLSPMESVLQWYAWAGRELHWTKSEVDSTELGEFFDMVLLMDKQARPDEYVPAETLFRGF